MDERAAGWHDNSPHTMIRMDGTADFRKEIRKCFLKTGREYSRDFQKMEIGRRGDIRAEIWRRVRICA
jgi:hypothetical protein